MLKIKTQRKNVMVNLIKRKNVIINGDKGGKGKQMINNKIISNSGNKSALKTISQKHINNILLITGGIGDFLTLDYFYDLTKYKTIYVISAQSAAITDLIKKFANYKMDRVISIDCKTQYDRQCFYSLKDIINEQKVNGELKTKLIDSHDYSILSKFPEIRCLLINNITSNMDIGKNFRYRNSTSSVLTNKLADIKYLELPKKYYFICHYSFNCRFNCTKCDEMHEDFCPVDLNKRNYIDFDWQNTINILRIQNMIGVVVGQCEIPAKYAKNDCLINLINKTNILESFEVLKASQGYIGIDTCYAVIASKLFGGDRLIIKSINKHGVKSKDIYYHNNNDMVEVYGNIPMI